MLTVLPAKIETLNEAKSLFNELHRNQESFHPEDDATQLSGDIFTQSEGEHLNDLMAQIYDLPECKSGDFDPCEYILDLINEMA